MMALVINYSLASIICDSLVYLINKTRDKVGKGLAKLTPGFQS
jgi:hypothetical protein